MRSSASNLFFDESASNTPCIEKVPEGAPLGCRRHSCARRDHVPAGVELAEGRRSTSSSSGQAQLINEPRTVPPSPEARKVVAQFINTAVARKNLAQAWKISGRKSRRA